MVCRKPVPGREVPEPISFWRGPKRNGFGLPKKKARPKPGRISPAPGAGERCEKAGCSTVRLRRYRAVLSWRVSTTSGRLPQAQKPRRPQGVHICPESRTAAGRNARKQSVPVITVFFGAGDRRTLHDPGQAFFFGPGTISFFGKKEMVPKKTRFNSQSQFFFPASPDAPGAPG